ncbi:MAG: shikimate kinase [Candidatus Izemoplasma sp.]
MYGLIGKHLSHSYSKIIHEKISSIEYNLIELDTLHDFFASKEFSAINVTIPYKTEVMQYLDQIDPLALEIGNVNTIVNKDSILYGYNTDYIGLEKSLSNNQVSLTNKNILILGNGATSRLIKVLCKHSNASNVTVLARNPKENDLSFNDIHDKESINIIFNTTPYGMYPNLTTEALINLEDYLNVEAVMDLIYNPLKTMLIQDAQRLNIKTINGLEMLVNQAVKANEIFLDTHYNNDIYVDSYRSLLFETTNFVLIGMPMSGKSHFSRLMKNQYNRHLVDIDRYIEEKEEMSINDIFTNKGEEYFRKIEAKYIWETAIQRGLIISTGGGTVLNKTSMKYLKANGLIIFINVPLNMLLKFNPKNRPLLKDKESVISLYNYRYPIYNTYTDILINKRNYDEVATLKKIEVKLDEYFGIKWS